MKPLPATRQGAWVLLALFVVVLLHGALLQIPWMWPDDAALTDLALHGRNLLRSYFHSEAFPYETFYAMGANPAYFLILRVATGLLGIGVVSVRLPSLIAGVMALLLLLRIVKTLRWPMSCQWTVVALAAMPTFFISTHEARPESFVLLCMLVNLDWLMATPGRLWSFIVGFVAVFGMYFHVATLVYLAPLCMIVLYQAANQRLRDSRWLWWMAGAFMSGVLWLACIDITPWTRTLAFTRYAFPHLILTPSLLISKAAVGTLIDYLCARLPIDFSFVRNPFQWLGFIGLVTAFVWQVRRWKYLGKGEQYWLLLLSGIVMFWIWISASINPRYAIYFQPLLILLAVHVAVTLWQRRMNVGLFGYGVPLLACMLMWRPSALWMLGSVVCLCLFVRFVVSHQRRHGTMLTAFLWLLFCAIVIDFIASAGIAARYVFEQQPFALFVALGAMYFLSFHDDGIRIRHTRLKAGERSLSLGLWLSLGLFFAGGLVQIRNFVYLSRPSRDFQSLMSTYSSMQRVVAPMTFWLYEPRVELQDPGALLDLMNDRRARADVLGQMLAYKPDLIWLLDRHFQQLEKEALNSRRWKVKEVRRWKNQFRLYGNEDLVEMELTRIQS